jgi:hypothetical protein
MKHQETGHLDRFPFRSHQLSAMVHPSDDFRYNSLNRGYPLCCLAGYTDTPNGTIIRSPDTPSRSSMDARHGPRDATITGTSNIVGCSPAQDAYQVNRPGHQDPTGNLRLGRIPTSVETGRRNSSVAMPRHHKMQPPQTDGAVHFGTFPSTSSSNSWLHPYLAYSLPVLLPL